MSEHQKPHGHPAPVMDEGKIPHGEDVPGGLDKPEKTGELDDSGDETEKEGDQHPQVDDIFQVYASHDVHNCI